ncbi:MAG: hypothetical protein JW714_01060 [Candidatus Omnitrophica bacterium]|nr:hypothetical protein [Candidatus Omnitrophota bacterium]
MYKFFTQKKAQSTLEYALLIAAIVGGLVAIQHYTKRAIQGRVRSSVDDVGEQYSAGHTTSKFRTIHEQTITKETFGVAPTTGADATDLGGSQAYQGVSRYEVVRPGVLTRETMGNEDETITRTFQQEIAEEGLIPR